MDVLLKGGAFNSQSSSQLSLKGASCQPVTRSGSVSIDEDFTDDSDASTTSPPSRRSIAVAKQILSEATNSFTPKLSISAAKHDMCKNTGALGPLVEMLRVSGDDKVLDCLETISFLSLDKANRKTITGLDGIGVLLEVIGRLNDQAIKISALQALVNLVRHEDAWKMKLWNHPNKVNALKLLDSKLSSTMQLLEAITCFKKIAFDADKNLIAPQLLSHMAELLHPSADYMVLRKVVRFLRVSSKKANEEHMRAWHSAVFKLAPLISPPKESAVTQRAGTRGSSSGASEQSMTVCEESLAVFLSLCEHSVFRNVVYASGCVPSLLVLPTSDIKMVRITAVCILSHLCESSLTCEQLCNEGSLITLLRLLHSSTCAECTIGLCYILCRLVVFKAVVKDLLRQCRTIPMLRKLQTKAKDEDMMMGISQLLELLEAPVAPVVRHAGKDATEECGPAAVAAAVAAAASAPARYRTSSATVV